MATATMLDDRSFQQLSQADLMQAGSLKECVCQAWYVELDLCRH
jgi:hypothetical protein